MRVEAYEGYRIDLRRLNLSWKSPNRHAWRRPPRAGVTLSSTCPGPQKFPLPRSGELQGKKSPPLHNRVQGSGRANRFDLGLKMLQYMSLHTAPCETQTSTSKSNDHDWPDGSTVQDHGKTRRRRHGSRLQSARHPARARRRAQVSPPGSRPHREGQEAILPRSLRGSSPCQRTIFNIAYLDRS